MKQGLGLLLVIIFTISFAVLAYEKDGFVTVLAYEHKPALDVIKLSESSVDNIGIKTERVQLSKQSKTIDINAIVEFLPDKHARITWSGGTGKVVNINVKVGDKIKEGQPLLSIQTSNTRNKLQEVRASLSGYVVRINTTTGKNISSDEVLMEIADPDVMMARGITYERPEIYYVKPGQPVTVGNSSIEKPLNGTVDRVDLSFDRKNRTINIFARVENKNHILIGYMPVVLSISTSPAVDVLTIPHKAVLGNNSEYFVYVMNNGGFEKRYVKLGAKFGKRVEITEGLIPNEEVVTVGNYQLQFTQTDSNDESATSKAQ